MRAKLFCAMGACMRYIGLLQSNTVHVHCYVSCNPHSWSRFPSNNEKDCAGLDLSSTIVLNDGVKIPRLGLGMSLSEPGTCTSAAGAVTAALKNGYKLIDTAIYYK